MNGIVALPKRDRRCPRHGARHVGDAIVHDAVDFVDRVLVGGGARCFETTALVNRDVNQNAPRSSSRTVARG